MSAKYAKMNLQRIVLRKRAVQLFRFRSISERLWQEVDLNQFYACEPDRLNDPLDCKIDPLPSLRRALSVTLDKDRVFILNDMMRKFELKSPYIDPVGVICFTSSMENAAMWSHYASNHSGVCLLYDFPEKYFAELYKHEINQHFYFVGGTEVVYGDNVFFDWLVEGDLNSPLEGEPTINAAAKLHQIKSSYWHGENEFRLIFSRPGVVTIEPGHLKQVAFGIKTEAASKRVIMESVSRMNPNARFAQAHPSSTKDLCIEFEAI